MESGRNNDAALEELFYINLDNGVKRGLARRKT